MIDNELISDINEIIKNNNESVYKPNINMTRFENKRPLYEAFGEKLVVDFGPVSISLTEEQKEVSFRKYISWCLSNNATEDYGRFLEANGIDGFFLNKNELKDTTVPYGMKLTRAASLFITDNAWMLNTTQNKYSEILNKNTVEGNFFISIHPFDFLSMSENKYNWRSCHALDGDYASGPLALMLDPSTAVAFIAPEKKVPIFDGSECPEWLNKKWRALIHISTDFSAFSISKHYPYSLEVASDLILDKVQELFDKRYEHVKNSGDFFQKIDVLTKGPSDVFYRDPQERYYIEKERSSEVKSVLILGESVDCLHCNTHRNYIVQSFEMACESCKTEEEYDYYCDMCGEGLYEDQTYCTQDNCYCEYCYDEFTSHCEECGESVENEIYDFEEEMCNQCWATAKQEKEKERDEQS